MTFRLISVAAKAFLFLGFLALSGCQSPPVAGKRAGLPAAEERLIGLMSERLAYAPKVAWVKYQNNAPILDARREQELLQAAEAEGAKRGLEAARVEMFFAAQMAASRRVQRELVRGWKRGRELPTLAPVDLRKEIRPRLERINGGMLGVMGRVEFSPALARETERRLRGEGYSWAAARTAAAGVD